MQDTQYTPPVPLPPGGYSPRRRTRWWIPVGIIVGLLVLIVGGFALFFSALIGGFDTEEESFDLRDRSVLILDLSGGVPEYKPPVTFNFGGDENTGPSLLDLLTALKKAKTDENISGVYIRSGGSGVGMAKLDEIRSAVADFKSSGKFVYAFADMATKSHYYLATVADSIFMPEEGMMEFNAFGTSAPFLKGLFAKLGVTWHVEQFEEYKSAAETMSRDSWSPAAKETIRAILDQRSSMFVSAIARSRKMDAGRIVELMNDGVYVPDTLLQSGLIDGLLREADLKKRIHQRLNPADSTEEPKLRTVTVSQYLSSKATSKPPSSDKGIAIVYASGPISSGKNSNPFDNSGIYSKALIKDLRAARDNDDVDAIILRIDSPGGSAYASDEIWAEVLKIRKTKPVYASMSDVAASGGYYIAMCCDTIICHPATITGSIGVIMALPNFSGTMDKIGVTVDTVSLGASSTFLNTLMPSTEKDREKFRSLGSGIYRRFVQKVADSRKMDFESTRLLARGRVWTGSAAKAAGLVDVEGGLQDAIKLVKARLGVGADETVSLTTYPERIDNLKALLKMFGFGRDSDDEDNTEARNAVLAQMLAPLGYGQSPATQALKVMPASMRSQILFSAQLTSIALKDRTMVMMPMILPLD